MDESLKVDLILPSGLKERIAHGLRDAGISSGMLFPAKSLSHGK
jgi:hypothetical protein